MKKYLKEISLTVSGMYLGYAKDLMVESRCILYFLESETNKKIESKFTKIAIKLWPIGAIEDNQIPEIVFDGNIAILNQSFDIEIYNRLKDLHERQLLIQKILLTTLNNLPSETGIEHNIFTQFFTNIEKENYVFIKEVGKWVSNNTKTLSAKLKFKFDSKQLQFSVLVKDQKSNVIKEVIFAELEPFQCGQIDLIGDISFTSDSSLIYQPKKHFPPISFDIVNEKTLT